jgi:hypothetical protein
MVRKPAPPTEQPRWKVTRLRGASLVLVGYVNAPTEAEALAKAAADYKVRPELQNRLVARLAP